jgi:hypothetical protein
MQLSLFDLPPFKSQNLLTFPNPKKAQRLRDLAEAMTQEIEQKLNPGIASQRPTARRARIARSIIKTGEQLVEIQAWLLGMADALETGNLPDILAKITTKAQLQQLQIFSDESWRDSELDAFFTDNNPYNTDAVKRLRKANLTNSYLVKQAILALKELYQPTPLDSKQREIRELEFNLIGVTIPGYFPTPKPVCDRLIQLALLEEGMKVLEPSAGVGKICEAIQEAAHVELDVCEINYDLREILSLKGFNVVSWDCFQLTYPQWHRIIANPPFGKALEVEHIYHYYNLLLPKGRMVAIVPESVEFSTKKVYKQFRQWLEDKCCFNQALPDGAFLHSDRPTSAKTRILVIEKF